MIRVNECFGWSIDDTTEKSVYRNYYGFVEGIDISCFIFIGWGNKIIMIIISSGLVEIGVG